MLLRAIIFIWLTTTSAGTPADTREVTKTNGGMAPLCLAIVADDLDAFRARLVRYWEARHRHSGQGLTDRQIVRQIECDGQPLLVYAQSVSAGAVTDFLLAGTIDEQVVEQALRREMQEVSGNP